MIATAVAGCLVVDAGQASGTAQPVTGATPVVSRADGGQNPEPLSRPTTGNERIDSALRSQLASAEGSALLDVVVLLDSQADLSDIRAATRAARLATVERRLREHATESQASLLQFLRARRAQGEVSLIRPLWVTNEVEVEATTAVIAKVAARSDVLQVRSNFTVPAPAPALVEGQEAVNVEPNVSLVHAPEMWSQGFRGQGVVVATMDTGVDVDHPDLAGSWRGGMNSWYDPNGEHPSIPTDVSGHGTQTMGVIVGGEAGGSAIGVAPDARWIAVKIFNDRGMATSVGIHLGFQWLLDPDGDLATPDAPNVVNNSWNASAGGCNTEFEQDLTSLRAARILPVFAAGNDGPASGTVFSPANLPEAFAVGGVDNAGSIDPSSSRGPSACAGAISPKLVAPGVSIHTTDLFGGYIDDTGTSIAAPHVAGSIALLLSAFPGLPADRQDSAFEASAVDLGANGLDPTFGFGELDVAAAYQWLTAAPDFTVSASPSSASTAAGGAVAFDVSVSGVNGFDSDVSLSLAGLTPSQATATFTPAVIPGGAGTVRLDLSTSASLTSGTYPLTINAVSGSLARSTQVALIVTPPPDFTVSASPSTTTVTAGASGTYAVTVGAVNEFAGDVTLGVTGLAAAVGTAMFLPPVVTGAATSTLTVSTLSTAPVGSYPLSIRATSGALTHQTAVTLVVSSDFALAVTPSSVTVKHGKTGTYSVATTKLGGFKGTVTLSATGVPSGATAQFARAKLPVPGMTTFKVRTTASTARGTHTMIITGTSGQLSHQVAVSITVT